ncbi:hypothetical protein [Streptomyces sp. TRM49041]|uniref:hypothetical protein n=1 Tax=Streptomyces sp. TRM49041 TaxID=2603216 RepID=UPI0011F04620|nr:hypothetical protein [Streptomyces sp. TRM49041]
MRTAPRRVPRRTRARFTTYVEEGTRRSDEGGPPADGIALEAGITSVPTEQVRSAAQRSGLPPSGVEAITDSYAARAAVARSGITTSG